MTQSSQIPFRKDDGSIVYLDFSEMMERMDAQGFIELDDGTLARRARDLESGAPVRSKSIQQAKVPVVSDALGFIAESLPEQRAHLQRTGIPGIEFKEDPDVPGFYQVHCDTEASKLEYAKSRGFADHNSRNGSGGISEYDLRNARELVERKFASQT